jgi:hypothetical protein
MSNGDRTEWERLLPEDLRKAAYKAGSESAWNRNNALRVIEILSASGYVILKVDIWLATKPGPTIPTPFVYDWRLLIGSPSPGYPRSAAEFVKTFEWDPTDKSHAGREPYFNILAEPLNS